KRGDEGVDPAAEILKVDEDGVERAHRLPARATDLAVQAEYRNLVNRIGEIVRFNHIVLFVAAKPVLRPERGREFETGRRERVETMRKIACHRGGMGKQRNALALERAAKVGIGEEPVDSEKRHASSLRKRCDEAIAGVEIGLFRRMRQ